MIVPGDTVLIGATDDWPEHLFKVDYVFEDCVGGFSLSGPMQGVYGEPDYDLIIKVVSRDEPNP